MTSSHRVAVPLNGSEPINPESAMPLFFQLFVSLRDAILNGSYQTGDKIPSEAELCAVFGVSRTTVRCAMDRLVSEGYVRRLHGKGTFVTKPVTEMRLLLDPSWARAMRGRGINPEVRTILLERVPVTPSLREKLATTSKVAFHIRNLVLGNGEPWVISEQYVDAAIGLTEDDLTNSILADRLSEQLGIRISESICLFLEPDLIGDDDASLLGVPPASAGLRIARQVTDSLGRAVLYSESLFRGDRCRLLFSSV
jgi:GntR family transcriptional regulator